VDNPTQNLESYFLDVVQKARAAQETSGAQSGARVAPYLQADMQPETAGDKLLEKLSLPQAPAPVAPVASVAPTPVDEKKLAALSQVTPAPAPVAPVPAAETMVKPEDLTKADEKLSSLLGGKQ
jgi:hypothetical protein